MNNEFNGCTTLLIFLKIMFTRNINSIQISVENMNDTVVLSLHNVNLYFQIMRAEEKCI